MKKILAVLLSIYISIIIFMPKKQILYTLLNQASQEKINFELKNLTDYGIFENIDKITFYYDMAKFFEVSGARFFPLLVYNRLSFSQINLVGSFKSMLEIKIIEAKLTENLLSPYKVSIYALSTIGRFTGSYDLKSNRLRVLLVPNDKFTSFKYKKYFKKTKEGYIYESIIKF